MGDKLDILLVDTHCHLTMPEFNEDRDEVIKRAIDNCVVKMINIGYDYESSLEGIKLAEKYPEVFTTIGFHPHESKYFSPQILEKFKPLISHPKVVGIGETGLDFYKNYSPKDEQKTVFRKLIKLAQEYNLPLIIHCRDAYPSVFKILEEEKSSNLKIIFHCFSGNTEVAQACIDKGYFISLAGPITFKNAKELKEVVQKIPLDHLLIETDAPYLTPEPKRGKRNEPENVRFIAKKIAEILKESEGVVAQNVFHNALSLFNLGEKEC